ncbi:hypothetical protein GCM10023311_20150 [Flaviramulus aquimarinus]|uniref:Uncharacterized protein n=1 Tax=Flaviramulus aquimarinus TaxID=1170456 RepID=A0ABP9F8I1_9FLAO
MHIKTLIAISLFVLSFSCKKTQDNMSDVAVEQNKSKDLTEKDIATIKYAEYALDLKTEDAIQDWAEYFQLQDIITEVKKGDLSYFSDNEEVIKLLVKEFKSNIPAHISSPSITARVLVLETKLYKLESLSNLSTTSKEELLNTIKAFFVAFSNLNLQMNKKIEFDSRSIEKP